MKIRAELTQVRPYQPGKPIEELRRELGLNSIIKLASNENPYGYSPRVKQVIEEELQCLNLYPDGAAYQLKAALAEQYQVKMEQLILGNGSDELLGMIARTFLQPGTAAVMATPSFAQYHWNTLLQGAEAVEVPFKAGVYPLASMLDAIGPETRVVWLCNPNNPTGTYFSQKELEWFLERVPAHVLVVVDEAYAEYVTASDYPKTLQLLPRYANLIILRTFSKIYGLAALRVGYGICSPELVGWLERVREPFNTNRIAQVAAVAAIQDQDFVVHCREKNEQEREKLHNLFVQLGWSLYPSQTNFLLIQLPPGEDDSVWYQYLLEQGLIIRAGTPLGMPGWIRITVGLPEENQRLWQLIEKRALSTTKR